MKGTPVICLAASLILATASVGRAQALKLRSTVLNSQKMNLIESLTLKGDLRLRHESFNKRTGTNRARQRQRFRFRLQGDIGLPNDFTIGTRLASGAGEQTSSNQSWDNLGSQKGIFIDRMFLRWKPVLSEDGSVAVAGGKIKNPMWQVYSSDIVWDTDYNPEGLGQSVEWFVPELGGIVFANALQTAVDEDSSSEADQWLFSNQIGAEYRLPFRSRLRLAGALHEWVNERAGTFGQLAAGEGNRRIGTTPVLANEFRVGEFTGQLSGWVMGRALRLQGTWIRNLKKSFVPGAEQSGYQVGAILGEASLPCSWEGAWFYKWSESDATVADLADSDFGDGGTNRRGHIFWLAYSPLDWMQLKAKYFYTRVIDESLAPGRDDINRVQVDWAVKF